MLEAIKLAVCAVKTAAQTPGVEVAPYAETVYAAICALQAAERAGASTTPYVDAIIETFSGDGIPSTDDLSKLDAEIGVIEMEMPKPLPPKEADEPQ